MTTKTRSLWSTASSRILTQHHFATLRAYSGPECLQIVRQRPVDLIVTDILMPGMDGFELLWHLRQLEKVPPVFVLTAKDDMVTRAATMSLGVSEFIVKLIYS
jgi:CheY-like chemotaxis protein